uniref:Regulatory protein YycH-like domain-containing protein n=1 Tax=uncultured Bacillota bacterium TaxID=344338 RepID=A0A650EN79_9FIRM|nr:hypothetical protein Firmicute1046_2860 [uncultured Firmicutes bacterium]
MDIAKVKTILIFVLVAINIALFSFLIGTRNQDTTVNQRSDDQVIALLNEKNIVLDKKLISQKVSSVPNCLIERMLSGDDKIVSKLLGGKYIKEEEGSYTNESKQLTIRGDSFRFTDAAPSEAPADNSPATIERYCIEAMKRMGISSENYTFLGMNGAGENFKALFAPKCADYPFFDANLDFEISSAGLVSVQGKNLISSNTVSGGKTEIFSIHSILVDFADNQYLDRTRQTVITSISLGYYIGHDAEQYKSVLAIPVWQIATDNGDIFYYDARNGKFLEP